MKTLKYIFVLVVFSVQLFSQEFCVSEGQGMYTTESVTMPAFGPNGTVRTLVILCKFLDDNFDQSPHTDVWPHTQNCMPS